MDPGFRGAARGHFTSCFSPSLALRHFSLHHPLCTKEHCHESYPRTGGTLTRLPLLPWRRKSSRLFQRNRGSHWRAGRRATRPCRHLATKGWAALLRAGGNRYATPSLAQVGTPQRKHGFSDVISRRGFFLLHRHQKNFFHQNNLNLSRHFVIVKHTRTHTVDQYKDI